MVFTAFSVTSAHSSADRVIASQEDRRPIVAVYRPRGRDTEGRASAMGASF